MPLVQLLIMEFILVFLVLAMRSHIITMPYLILPNKYVLVMMF